MPTCCQACKPHSVYMAIATVLNILVHTLIFFSIIHSIEILYFSQTYGLYKLSEKKKKKTFWGVLWFIYPRSHTLVLLCCLAPPYFYRHLLLLALLYCVTPPKCLHFFFLISAVGGPGLRAGSCWCRLFIFFFFPFSTCNDWRVTCSRPSWLFVEV